MAQLDYVTVLEGCSYAIVTWDRDDRIVYANAVAERLFGWDNAQLQSCSLTTIIPDHVLAAHGALLVSSVVTNGQNILSTPIRARARHHDGHEFDVDVTSSAFPQSNGSDLFVALLQVVQDGLEPERQGVLQRLMLMEHNVMRILVQVRSLDDVAQRIPAAIAESIEWDVAVCWLEDTATGVLKAGGAWATPTRAVDRFIQVSRRAAFLPGEGLAGRVWDTRKPVWSVDVVRDRQYMKSRVALADGLHAACLVSVESGEKIYGVLELLHRSARERDEQLLQSLVKLGTHIGKCLQQLERQSD